MVVAIWCYTFARMKCAKYALVTRLEFLLLLCSITFDSTSISLNTIQTGQCHAYINGREVYNAYGVSSQILVATVKQMLCEKSHNRLEFLLSCSLNQGGSIRLYFVSWVLEAYGCDERIVVGACANTKCAKTACKIFWEYGMKQQFIDLQ